MASSQCHLLPHRIHRTLTSSASILSSIDLPPSASQKLLHRTPDHISSVVSLLRSFGVSGRHLAKLVYKRPRVLACRIPPLESKLQFLYSFGFTYDRIGKLLSSDPRLVRYSLTNRIAPNFHRLRPLFGDDLISSICHAPRLLALNIEDNFLPNIKALKAVSMPDSAIKRLILLNPRALSLRPHEFERPMQQLQKMGYDFSTDNVVGAFAVLACMSESTWDRKLRLLESLGFSAEEILTLFRMKPNCIEMSDDRIQSVEFFINTLHWTPATLVKHPEFLRLNLERNIIRRCSVFNLLVSKQAISRKMLGVSLFHYSETEFMERYVKKYQDKVPAVLDAYQGKLKLASPELECNIRPNVRTLKRYNLHKSVISSLVRK